MRIRQVGHCPAYVLASFMNSGELIIIYNWDFFCFTSFIENFGTHIITSATIGGRDVVYIRQHQSSPLSESEIEHYVKEVGEQRFLDSKSQSTAGPLSYKDKVSRQQASSLFSCSVYLEDLK